jgi:hypothetical protein
VQCDAGYVSTVEHVINAEWKSAHIASPGLLAVPVAVAERKCSHGKVAYADAVKLK